MKYLTPEIAAFYENMSKKSLVRANTSCGIFQECDYDNKDQEVYQSYLNRKHGKK
ncbi:hypothetical protein Q4566_06385 [Tamlana sp. 2_MG-2023]|uniref:hypothetical protein n=1 Tax=unclassified Tamlana TaxID=2614803 RepID=UPI0026E2C207|nr:MULTISPECIES: hypothetical protein [unclassified Tamlana]MDO6759824.1 hypothetical protein [Tamlana sp. 2_MG-2023]MDO6791447.1 hypothetical protein [Tamlana sp. 1_MG-2023]